MVLSNKKLKQKLRAESAQNLINSNAVIVDNPDSSSNTSFKQLLDTASHTPRLSKRDVLRKLRSLQPPSEAAAPKDEGTNKENGVEDLGDKKKNNSKKRKGEVKDEDLGNKKNNNNKKSKGEVKDDDLTNGVLSDASEPKKQKPNKAKARKQKQKQNKAKSKEQKQNKETENGSNNEPEMPEATELTKINASISEDNGGVPTKVYVGGIPYYSTEDDIRSYFESCGTITEVDCLSFPDTGKFRGIALISFKTEAAAKRALALDGADMGGLFLKIQPYKIQSQKSTRFAPETVEGYNRIYVGNLSGDIKEGELRKFFSNCNITSLRFGMDKETGEFKGYAHVDFGDSQSLKTALTLDQCVLLGRPVRVSHAVPLKNLKKKTDEELRSTGNTKMKNRRCYNCHENGHFESQCPKKIPADPLADLQEKPDEEHAVPLMNLEEKPTKMKNRRCYNCHEKGHFDSECPKKIPAVPLTDLQEKPDEERAVPLMNLEEKSTKMKNRRCYNCREKGHFDSECPKKIPAVPLMDLQEKPDEEHAVPLTNLEEKPYEEPSSSLSNKKKSRRCYNCREKGHLDSECPKKQSSLV